MNNFSGIGRITRDIELKYAPSGTAIANLSIAIDRSRKDADGNKVTDFIDVVAFGKTAELVSQYCVKGVLIGISGELQIDTWKTDEGFTRKAAKVVAERVDFLSSKSDTEKLRAAQLDGPPAEAQAHEQAPVADDDDPFGSE